MNPPIVMTRSGQVRGRVDQGITRFLGIPYAAPPLGEARFQPPRPPVPWEGVRDATAPGPTAPQLHGAFPGLELTPVVGSGWRRGDDFLNVNVATPDIAARGLPVLVFIHGGGFVGGSNDATVQDGTGFARSGVVCVALNYRLGVEGFLPIPGAPTNLGLRDQLAALGWVRENIAAFGGDPTNVTVFGESAGAMSVANLMTSPLAKGLFRRAIVQSGHGSMVRAPGSAARLVHQLARRLGVTPDVEGFRRRTVEQCLAALAKVSRPLSFLDLRDERGLDAAFGLSRFLPVHGDDVLPEPPLEALAKGAGAEVELLIGTNAQEMNLYFVPTGVRRGIPGWLAALMLSRSVRGARAILDAYGLKKKGRRPGEALTEAMHDLVFRWPARQFAAAHRGTTHFYEFGWRSPACGGELGACHGLELPFVFDTLASCTGPNGLVGSAPPQALADRIHRLWAGFATDGKLPWPEYDARTRQVCALETGETFTDASLPAERYLPRTP
ncbi:carboxylesterase/lipase family protein [Archangium sp. Cb G35]|uniref:carboxylesterase/lipase family protein n=1 Tax=Archangium sp. Cb G35 TaxID=1920190 RepID=UPI0018E92A44|nr:carboxylesterase family protein [Archangium sp. Cb G35]